MARYARTDGRRARDVMTTGLVTVEQDAPTECVVLLLERGEVGRVPVVRHGSLLGIVPAPT